jgi:hypothetical protein
VRLDNDGNRRIGLSTLSLESGGGWHQEFKGAGTVLAGAWKQWTFDLPSRQLAPFHLSAKAEGGTLQGELTPPP